MFNVVKEICNKLVATPTEWYEGVPYSASDLAFYSLDNWDGEHFFRVLARHLQRPVFIIQVHSTGGFYFLFRCHHGLFFIMNAQSRRGADKVQRRLWYG